MYHTLLITRCRTLTIGTKCDICRIFAKIRPEQNMLGCWAESIEKPRLIDNKAPGRDLVEAAYSVRHTLKFDNL